MSKIKPQYFYKSPKQNAPTILVCNDDGIYSEGIEVLATAMKKLGNVLIVAPAYSQSARGHAMTIDIPLRIQEIYKNNKFFGYSVVGTSVDSIKISLSHIVEAQPDIIVSGINHGSNTASNVLYSSTVAAALEGALAKIPSIAFSIASRKNIDFTFSKSFVSKIAHKVMENGLPEYTILSVNIPNLVPSKIKGVAITEQGRTHWKEHIQTRLDTSQEKYYWIEGEFVLDDHSIEADEYALRNGYASITPLSCNLTNHSFKQSLKAWNIKK